MPPTGDKAPERRNVDFVWLFLRLGGRIGRKAYALAAALMIIWQAFIVYRIGIAEENSAEIGMWSLVLTLTFPLILWSSFALSVKRLHDLGKPGALAMVLLVPMLSVIIFIILCLIPGDRGANEYGEAPNRPG